MTHVQEPVQPEPGVLVHTRPDRERAIATWLLSATEERRRARLEWQETGVAMLRCGTLFSAVRITARLVHAACGTDQTEAVNAHLAKALLGGPVIHDPRHTRYYALVPADTATKWLSTKDTEGLGRDCYLGVPRPHLTTYDPQTWCPYWSVPMPSAGELCVPHAVAQLAAFGRFRIASEAGG